MITDVFNQKNEKVGKTELPAHIFSVKWNPDLAHQALRAQLSNKRRNIALTKDRSEVRGGGKKPWRQKGTGRARHGSIRSPIWKGGGVTFGPGTEKKYERKINKKMRQKAIFSILSLKLQEKNLKIIENFKLANGKTKILFNIIKKFILPEKDSLLIIPEKGNEEIYLAGRNIPKTKILNPLNLNVYDLLKYKYIFLAKDSIKTIEEHYRKNQKSKIKSQNDNLPR